MIKGKEKYQQELIDKYNYYKILEIKAAKTEYLSRLFSSAPMWRSKQTEIAKRFEKVFHEPIDKYIK